MKQLSLEFAKMRRLRTVPLIIALTLAVAAVGSASQFSSGTTDSLHDPARNPWAAHLLSYTMMAAMLSPLFMAILASRQTDIEHQANGWIMNATAGTGAGRLCRAKAAALGCFIVPATFLQTLAVMGFGWLAGNGRSLAVLPWFGYTALLALLNLALCASHILLSARFENQLLSMGVGLLGSFAAVFCLLAPGPLSKILPWGFYAVISCARQTGRTSVSYTAPPAIPIMAFLGIVGVAFFLLTARFDRWES